MAGHSKYHNIRFRKAKQDAAKDRVASRFQSLIKGAMKDGNTALLDRIVKDAKKQGVRADVIDRALQRGRARSSGTFSEILYEGNLELGVVVMIECLTDNPRRTAPEVRAVLTKAGGALGASGAAAWAFTRRGFLEYEAPAEGPAREALIEAAMDAGAEDIDEGEAEVDEVDEGGSSSQTIEVWTSPSELTAVRDAIAEATACRPASEQLIYDVSGERIALGEEDFEVAATALSKLEALEDVEHVYHNMKPRDEVNS